MTDDVADDGEASIYKTADRVLMLTALAALGLAGYSFWIEELLMVVLFVMAALIALNGTEAMN